MQPALSTVCSLNASIETIVADYAAGHCNTVELWLGHAENYVANNSVSALKELFLAHNVNVIAASFQGGLFADSEDARIEHLKHFKSRLQMLQATMYLAFLYMVMLVMKRSVSLLTQAILYLV